MSQLNFPPIDGALSQGIPPGQPAENPLSPVLVVLMDGDIASGWMVEFNAIGVFLIKTRMSDSGHVAELPEGDDEVFFPIHTVKRVQKLTEVLTTSDLSRMLGIDNGSGNGRRQERIASSRPTTGRKPYRF